MKVPLAVRLASGDLVPLLPVHPAPVGEEQDVVMGAGHEQVFRSLPSPLLSSFTILPLLSLDAPAAPVLVPEVGEAWRLI